MRRDTRKTRGAAHWRCYKDIPYDRLLKEFGHALWADRTLQLELLLTHSCEKAA